MFGAQLAAVDSAVRERQKLEGGGVALTQVFPGTSAADAEFKAGDVILAVDGAKISGIPAFLERVAKTRAGDVWTVDLVRDGVRLERRVTFREMPREKGEEIRCCLQLGDQQRCALAHYHHAPNCRGADIRPCCCSRGRSRVLVVSPVGYILTK